MRQETNGIILNGIVMQKVKSFDWDLACRNQAGGYREIEFANEYGTISNALSRSYRLSGFWFSWYFLDFAIYSFAEGREISVKILEEEQKACCRQENEFYYPDEWNLTPQFGKLRLT